MNADGREPHARASASPEREAGLPAERFEQSRASEAPAGLTAAAIGGPRRASAWRTFTLEASIRRGRRATRRGRSGGGPHRSCRSGWESEPRASVQAAWMPRPEIRMIPERTRPQGA